MEVCPLPCQPNQVQDDYTVNTGIAQRTELHPPEICTEILQEERREREREKKNETMTMFMKT